MFENISERLKERAAKIKIIGFDVDGVLSDGTLFINEHGEMFKQFCSLDGYGLRLAGNFGIKVCVISARKSPSVHKRFESFDFHEDVFTGIGDKLSCMEEILSKHNLSFEEAAFLGDDALDIPVLEKVGLAGCPPNAHFSVKKLIHYITDAGGGYGSAREFVDLILYAQGKIPNN